jgi:hypothetical protein
VLLSDHVLSEEEYWWILYYHHEVEPPERYLDKFIVLRGLIHECYTLAYERMMIGL